MIEKKAIIGKYKNAKHWLSSVYQVIKTGYPAKRLKVIGVTGTDGKTTTSHLIYEILKASGKKTALVSTVGVLAGKKLINTGFHTTTPDATVLQPLFSKFAREGIKYVVLEVTSHGLDQHRVLGSNFWMGILTNITSEHLDYHKTLQKYKEAKAKLFRGVRIAIFNHDDKSFLYLKKQAKKADKIISYGRGKNVFLKINSVKQSGKKLNVELSEFGKKHKISVPILGLYNAYNIAASVAAARAMGIEWKIIKKTLRSFSGTPGRMQIITPKNHQFQVVVDFAHTPNALENALKTLRELKTKDGRIIAVFGAAGERDKKKRAQMGKISAQYADISIFTAEDSRHEDVFSILKQIAVGAKRGDAKELTVQTLYKRGLPRKMPWFIQIPERWEAIAFAIQKAANKNDIIGIFGKGHEKSLAFESYEHPWSDVDFAKKVLVADPKLAAIVLAAGRGTRMKSKIPKVLHKIAGRPMISYVLETLRKARFGTIAVVVGYKKEDVIREIGGAVLIATQRQTLGTGHAPLYGLKVLPDNITTVLIAMGDDSVFYTPELLQNLVKKHKNAAAKMTLATIKKKNPGVVGYIQRDDKGNIIGIKEWRLEKKPPPKTGEINAALYVFDRIWLGQNLKKLKKHENGEYFITDLVDIAIQNKDKIQGIPIPEKYWFGVNNQSELREANRRILNRLVR